MVKVIELAVMSKLTILTKENLFGFVSIWKPLLNFLLELEKKKKLLDYDVWKDFVVIEMA